MSEEIKPHHLRALASDIEDCHNPQSWVDYCRAAAAMLEIQADRIAELETALKKIAELESALKKIVEKTKHAHPMSFVSDYYRIAHDALEGGKKDE